MSAVLYFGFLITTLEDFKDVFSSNHLLLKSQHTKCKSVDVFTQQNLNLD